MGDLDTQRVHIDGPLTEGFAGQTAAVRERDAEHFVHMVLLVGSFRQDAVGKNGNIFHLIRKGLLDQLVPPEGTQLLLGLLGSQLLLQLCFQCL